MKRYLKSIVIGLVLIAGVVFAGEWLQTDSTNRFYKHSWNEYDVSGPGVVWNAYSDSIDNLYNKLWRDAPINVKADYGAVGDGVTDDAAAIQAAIDATPIGGKLEIPRGKFRFASQLTINKAIELAGYGVDSVLWPDIDTSTDAIVIGDSAAAITGLNFHDFWILGPAGSSQNVMTITRVHHSRFHNIGVYAGTHATGYAVKVTGCIYNDYDLQLNIGYSGSYSSGAVAASNGMKVLKLAVPLTHCNVNRIRAYIDSVGYGLYIDDQGGSGQHEITGVFSNSTNYPLYINNAKSILLHNAYFEGNTGHVTLNDVQDSKFMGIHQISSGDYIDLTGDCRNVEIGGQSRLYNINIGSSSYRTILGQISLENVPGPTAITDNGLGTIYKGPISIHGDVANYGRTWDRWGEDKQNKISNSAFERWQSDRPDGWSKDAATTWTKCGTGLGDTELHATDFSAKGVNTSFKNARYTISGFELTQAKGRNVSFSLWVYYATGQSPSEAPYVRVYADAGTDKYDKLTLTAADSWQFVRVGQYIPTDTTVIYLDVYWDKTIYIAEPAFLVGSHGQAGWIQEHNEHRDYMTIAGKKITYGATAPAAGWWDLGDICFNTGATASGIMGWKCVVAGTSGTWIPFGTALQIDNSDSATSGAGEDDLTTLSILADSMGATGGLRIIAAGTKTGGAGNKTIKLYWGSSGWEFNAAANDTNDWRVEAVIFNTATNAQRISWQGWNGATPLQGYETETEDTTGAITVKITGECADGGDTITQTMWIVERL